MKNPHGCTGHVSKHIILIREIVRANRVMEEMIGTRIIGIVSRRDENHWQAFGISTHHSVERRKGSNIEGSNDRPNSIGPCIPFSSICRIEFIATTDLLNILVPQKLIKQNEVIVTWDHEVVFQADLLEPRREIISNRVGCHCGSVRRWCGRWNRVLFLW